MQKLILTNFQSPGDLVMLTAAVRDLHTCYPNQFVTDVRTGSPELWEHNPWLTPLEVEDPGARVLECNYPLIEVSNQRPVHFLHGFIEYLNDQIGMEIKLTRFAGDIHLSDAEKSLPPLVEQITGLNVPYWIIVAGGKFDYTIKWWHFRRWQAVVDRFRGNILFVQVGEQHHYHPALNGVLDLRGKTTLRELIRLVYHAQGILCPVTLVMHLAAAVEPKPGGPPDRPCVVVAGGREPPSWEAYPTHQFIHTIGRLPCCSQGGCWRSRSVPLGDGDEKDQPHHLCVDVVANLPRCMHLITAEQVAQAIGRSMAVSPLRYLTARETAGVRPFVFHRTDVAGAQVLRLSPTRMSDCLISNR
ncbi:MAG TPA: glycosyltransferase family 9 protein [Desulfuromonadaceae bacterium]|nr:glycosyltransferase family 9 protein [Desulfuromonadaceae bacterium]